LQAQAFKKFIPMFDRVLVERFAAEIKTKSGIMIPEKAQGKIQQATVRAVGSGGRTEVALPLTLYISYQLLILRNLFLDPALCCFIISQNELRF
jgi:chaperonin GroES